MLKNDRIKRKKRIRAKVFGTPERPRLSVYRSNKYIYSQLIDDTNAVTIAASNGSDPSVVGKEIAEKAAKKKISVVVFDRNGFLYHGRIKNLAEAAREAGLKF